MRIRRTRARLAALLLAMTLSPLSALAYQPGTLYSGVQSNEVKNMQTALISLGYLGGTPDGIFGTHTEKAVKKFQRANGLSADGVAGKKTLELIYKKAGKTSSSGTSSSSSASSSSSSSSASSTTAKTTTTTTTTTSAATSSSSSSLFGGNYTTLRMGATGSRVKTLQQALIAQGYLKGSADGKYGKMTFSAVEAFQKAHSLSADGVAGKKTLTAVEKAAAGGSSSSASSSSSSSSSSGTPSSGKTASGPSGSQVKLLHWFNDVKPGLRTGQKIELYEPSSGQSWTLRLYSLGRHADAEPATAEDTASMLKAFGGQNTWSQKAVYVRLPSGAWTIGSTHTMPHMSGSIKDNNFDGHLCVHFLRTMSECEKNDPNYGVSNQKTIRSFWKSLTGETISD